MYKLTGPDLLHTRVLRTLEDMLCGYLNHFFNKSAEKGIIPADWKSANVTAIHKRNETDRNLETTVQIVSHL